MKTIIETKNLTKTYRKKQALDHFDFQLRKGDICGLIGKNGAGKSTFMKLLAGTILPSSGQITLFGKRGVQGNKYKKRIGFLFEDGFMPTMNAYQNLEYFQIQKGITDPKEVMRVLELVDMKKNALKKYKQYSTGMKRRLALALALLSNPDILILDEPVNGLDPEGIADVRHLLLKLNRENGISILLSSHILQELQNTCSRFVFIDEGKCVGEFSKQDFEQMNCKRFLIYSKESENVCKVLELEFPAIEYTVLPDKTVAIIGEIETDKIITQLVKSNVSISEAKQEHQTLEQQFLETVGGAK